MTNDSKGGRGGRRPGAGRPKGDTKLYTFRAGGDIAKTLDAQRDKTAFIKESIERAIDTKARGAFVQNINDANANDRAKVRTNATAATDREPDLSRLGKAVQASSARGLRIPLYDNARVVAGFPVPLDNDEKSQDIDMLRLLCPHPESSYLIRVQGESMIDAGIESGDIVIVDKSRREPSEKEIAVCELNGEYTLKRICIEKDGSRYLVPANPDFPRFRINDTDAFCVWGTVTYIIHKARD